MNTETEQALEKVLDQVEQVAGKDARDKYERNAKATPAFSEKHLGEKPDFLDYKHEDASDYGNFFDFALSPEGWTYWDNIWDKLEH